MKQWMNERELAELLGFKPATMRKWRVYGEGPRWRKVGGRVLYGGSDVQAFLDACTSGGGGVRHGAAAVA